MRRKTRRILQDQQGLSMILVLCIGAVFVALSAALVYAASVLTANANRQLLEQEVYQLATSFSDVLEGELNTPDSAFAAFVNNTYMTSEAYGKNIFEDTAPATVFPCTESGVDTIGADSLKITLVRRPGEDVDNLNLNNTVGQSVTTAGDASAWQTQLTNWQQDSYVLSDLQLDVTVTVEKAGESFAYTVTYNRQVHYPVAYYTIDSNTTEYKWIGGSNFTSTGGDRNLDDGRTHTIVPHFDTKNPSNFSYKRGAKQSVKQG